MKNHETIRQLKNRKYLVTTLEDTDSNIERRKRHQILSWRATARDKYTVANLVKPAEVGLTEQRCGRHATWAAAERGGGTLSAGWPLRKGWSAASYV
jgi:hypothetical protein